MKSLGKGLKQIFSHVIVWKYLFQNLQWNFKQIDNWTDRNWRSITYVAICPGRGLAARHKCQPAEKYPQSERGLKKNGAK